MPGRYFIFLFLLIFGCSPKDADESPVERIEGDGIKIEIRSSSQKLRTCDLLELTIDVVYPQSFKIKLPDSKADFGDFSLYQINQNSPLAVNESSKHLSQVIILEPGLPAKHKLPPLNFDFWNEKNEQQTYSSKTLSFDVVSSIDAAKNKEIEDIITHTDKSGNTVVIVGSSALAMTILYLLFFCKPEGKDTLDEVAVALENIRQLGKLPESEILKQLPGKCAHFIKAKYSIQQSSGNLDVMIDSLEDKEVKGKLKELLQRYNKLRYSSKEIDKEGLRNVLSSFEDLFQELSA